MAEETWHAARLIPTSGINGAEEQERRATSALLAVMSAVREFGRAIVGPLGAPGGTVESFIEVPFDLDGRRIYPDGLIRVSRGRTSWTALVEVKTGTNKLEAPQIEAYLDVARLQGFNALLTISNEIPPIAGQHPTPIDKRKLKRVDLHHLSWTQVLTEAVMQKVHRGVSDPDQAWVLGELIRYLEHPRSGAMEFEDMGSTWVPVREAVTAGTLRPNDKGLAEVASRWDQLVRYVCLRLGRQLGVEVHPVLSRKEVAEPTLRAQSLITSACTHGVLAGAIRIPVALGPVDIVADLRAGRVSCSIDVEAPRQGRPATRVNWLLRQLKDAPGDLRVDAFAAHARGTSTSVLLDVARQDPLKLVHDPKKELRTFRITQSSSMGMKRGQGRGSFVSSVVDLVESFYDEVVQRLKPWEAPKLRPGLTEPIEPGISDVLVSTSLSSQDGTDPPSDPVGAGAGHDPVPEEPSATDAPALRSDGNEGDGSRERRPDVGDVGSERIRQGLYDVARSTADGNETFRFP